MVKKRKKKKSCQILVLSFTCFGNCMEIHMYFDKYTSSRIETQKRKRATIIYMKKKKKLQRLLLFPAFFNIIQHTKKCLVALGTAS